MNGLLHFDREIPGVDYLNKRRTDGDRDQHRREVVHQRCTTESSEFARVSDASDAGNHAEQYEWDHQQLERAYQYQIARHLGPVVAPDGLALQQELADDGAEDHAHHNEDRQKGRWFHGEKAISPLPMM